MNSEQIPSSLPCSISTEETHPLSLPLFLTSSSVSLKPLRDRNRTNLKRRINLSRSQVLSNDFENDDNLSTTPKNIDKTTSITTNSQSSLSSTSAVHTYTELYSKTISPKTPSPIHTTVTCSQVWARLASNEDHPNPISPRTNEPLVTSISLLPTHISFSYDPSDEDEGEDVSNNVKDNFQYVPLSSQSRFVQFQFLNFARQQQLDPDTDDHDNNDNNENKNDSDEDDDEDEDIIMAQSFQEHTKENEQENQISKKRKRSISTTDSLDALSHVNDDTAAASSSSTVTKPPCSKKPKIKDPNANFQRLNMRKKQFSHAKKHQFAKHKRNAFYRRTRNAGGNK